MGAQPKAEELLQPAPLTNAETFLGWTIHSWPGLSASTPNGGFSATQHSPDAPSTHLSGPLVWGMKGQSCDEAQGKERRGWMQWVIAVRGDGADPSSNILTCANLSRGPALLQDPAFPGQQQ